MAAARSFDRVLHPFDRWQDVTWAKIYGLRSSKGNGPPAPLTESPLFFSVAAVPSRGLLDEVGSPRSRGSVPMTRPVYRALVSSDWSECLSPNGPFDPIAFTYPHLAPDLTRVFKEYTGNRISLPEAYTTITRLLPGPLTVEHMDAYLDRAFRTYAGVPELVKWCADHRILFMINTTGTQGYFQRIFAKGLLPDVAVVAANPLIRFSDLGDASRYVHEVIDTPDKAKNTEAVIREWNIPLNKVAVMGDSGGDGPHFAWAAERGIFTIGSMTKASLKEYCQSRSIVIDEFFGLTYSPGEARNVEEEMKVDFMRLADVIDKALDLWDR